METGTCHQPRALERAEHFAGFDASLGGGDPVLAASGRNRAERATAQVYLGIQVVGWPERPDLDGGQFATRARFQENFR